MNVRLYIADVSQKYIPTVLIKNYIYISVFVIIRLMNDNQKIKTKKDK